MKTEKQQIRIEIVIETDDKEKSLKAVENYLEQELELYYLSSKEKIVEINILK